MGRKAGSKNKPKLDDTKAKKATKAPKAPKAAKPKKVVPSAAKADVGKGHNGTVDQSALQSLFLAHGRAWDEWQGKLKVIEKIEADVKAALKNDGFTCKQFQIRDDLLKGGPKKEQKVRGEIKDRLMVARFIGHALGEQYDLFEQPNRTPIAESAYEAGKIARMDNKPASPPHDPSTEAYGAWMRGFHEENDRQNMANVQGIKPLEQPEPTAPEDEDATEEAAGWGDSKLPAAANADTDL